MHWTATTTICKPCPRGIAFCCEPAQPLSSICGSAEAEASTCRGEGSTSPCEGVSACVLFVHACVGRGSEFDSRLGCNFLPCPISHAAPALGSLARATFHSLPTAWPAQLHEDAAPQHIVPEHGDRAQKHSEAPLPPHLRCCILGIAWPFRRHTGVRHVTQRVRPVCQACFQRCGCDRLPSRARARARAHIIRNAGARQMRRLHRGTPRSLSTEHGVSQRLRVICMRRTRVCAQNGAG